jgi:hypothetical protein
MPDAPHGAADPKKPVRLLASQIGVDIDPADFDRIAAMVQALWRSGGRIRSAFDNNVSVIPLTVVPDHISGVSE